MYAVIEAAGKQHVVHEGDRIRLNKHEGQVGDTIKFDNVLMYSNGKGDYKIGTPTVANAHVEAKVVNQAKGPKLIIFKYKKRKNYNRKIGHAQPYTELEISKIKG